MTRIIAFCAGAAALLLPVWAALAHHAGSTSNSNAAGPINTIPATTLEEGHVAVLTSYEYSHFGGLSDAALIDAAGKHIHAHSIKTIESLAAGIAYGITDDFMISVRLPFVRRTDIREGHHEHVPGGIVLNTVDMRGNTTGIGDLLVLGQYRMPRNLAFGTEWAVLFGVKAPTGRTNEVDNFGNRFEAEFQPGSGSWDVVGGLAVTQHIRRWSFDANVMLFRTGTGTQDTNLGDRFQYNAAISYRALGWIDPQEPKKAAGSNNSPFALDLVLEFNGEVHKKTVEAGVIDANSGGNVAFLSPGIRAAMGGVSAFVSFGIPIVKQMNGLQSAPDYRVLGGIAAVF